MKSSTSTPNQGTDSVKKLESLLQAEAKKKNSRRILLGVQSRDKSKLDFRQCAGSDTSISTKDPFFIASQTKLMTSTVIFQLVDEGKMSLDDCMAQYLPAEMIDKIHVYKGKDYSSEIKIHELLHQTSGIPDYFLQKDKTTGACVLDSFHANEDHEWTRMDYLNRAKQITPVFEPSAKGGKRSLYSDTNWQLLGEIIERVTEKSIAENFQERIFQPLGLSADTYVFDINKLAKDRTPPMNFFYKEKELDNVGKIMSSFQPDGAVVSTMDDMLVFLRAYFDGKLFDNKKHQQHEENQTQWNTVFVPPLQYGYGLMRFKLPKWMTLYCFDIPPIYGHSGANASFSFYSPDKEVFMVGTFNQIDQESRPFEFMLKVLGCV
ncbi:UPF0214 protein YfeW [Seminavis robusta]|uniref:UPF0214 protein YfeW n=1 Tax=Seminavis robusta TaxID=568900 RepID=A0A9N8HXX4_9STRA|nr:UPF0214 protein YfeW [Seminavis robusta]|eukprot:Sro2337_g323840.1 UPF0214 protein YfeW (377) ;mRNA; f:1350-2480